ncbi:MAG: DUF4097 family beta strand repeat protein [Ruminococcus sp.]|nr:DUF4097 family beta strand repeat protein [Ruminococcus sp.]
MKKSTKVLLIISLCMLLSGVFICVGAGFMAGFDFNGLSPVTYRESVTTSDEAFANVDVYSLSADVEMFVSSTDEWKVESTEADKIYHQITVEDDTLKIRRVDNREWYECISININFKTESIRLYLPEKSYESIVLKSTSGKVVVNEGLNCEKLKAESTSGAVRVYGAEAEEIVANSTSGQAVVDGVSAQRLSVSSTSGRVNVSNLAQVDTVDIKATSGRIEAMDISCREFTAENVSGGVTCSGVVADDTITAETTSGGIRILQSDAESLSLKSTSGSIRGTLLSDKIFIAESSSGSVKVPDSTQGGVCKAKTSSGSIDITVE